MRSILIINEKMVPNNNEFVDNSLVSIRDFEKNLDLLITSNIERYSYLKLAKEQKVAFVFLLHEENDNNQNHWLKFTSYIFINNKEDIEIEINKKFYKELKNPCVWGIFYLNNVKIVFEAKLGSILHTENEIHSIKMFKPHKMIRYQRRNSYRAIIPLNSKFTIDLEFNNIQYKNIPIVNLSITGAALLLNTDEELNNIPDYFENVIFNLDGEIINKINIKVLRVRPSNPNNIPVSMLPKNSYKNWYELGVKFDNLSYQVEQELFVIVNNLTKKVKD